MMGAPSLGHEDRVAELESLATLAGFTSDARLPWRLRPDVARICPSTGAMFLGDAKQTEDPGCAATLRRLRWYGIAMASMPRQAYPFTVALAVPAGSCGAGWARALVLSVDGRMVCDPPSETLIGGTIIVATRARRLRADRRHPYRDRPWPAPFVSAPSGPSTSSAAQAD
jgi:hypothetical protein